MILLCGIPSEPGLEAIAKEVRALTSDYRVINQRRTLAAAIQLRVRDGEVSGLLIYEGEEIPLEGVTGLVLRTMDDQLLPELTGMPAESPLRVRTRRFHDLLGRWADISPACVINRPRATASNFSKPYQQQLIAADGFATPPTLITNLPAAVHAFVTDHARVIFKSISSERSVVREITNADFERLDAIRWCPVQFQAFVPGDNVRVHVVGDSVFATRIRSSATDYRYAFQQVGRPAVLEPLQIDEGLEACSRSLASSLGLEVAGIDLKLPPNDRPVCLEVNPSPAFTYYELQTGQPIAAAIARHLYERERTALRPTQEYASNSGV